MLSLLTEQWIPVRRRDARLDWIAPHQIGDPDIVAFAAARADFNGALAQGLAGLLQTTAPVDGEGAWEDFYATPPAPEVLARWFAAAAPAFILDGDGARFMQDISLPDGAECAIDALLIDAPGSSAIDKNTDHFVKRETVRGLCPHCVATALLTLQTNAPAGGAGHRTSLRGGGPLTTLVVPARRGSLWHDLWMNVLPREKFLERSGDAKKTAPHFTFPWLEPITKIQAAGGETQPAQVHPYHVFWAMPRRIRVDFDGLQAGRCDVCQRETDRLATRYVTRPQGLNYKGPWRHPYSPYYELKGEWLPVHPQPGGFSYRNWLSWALGGGQGKKEVRAAAVVDYHLAHRQANSGEVRLWVFGFDMDNMKARCWYETTFPLYRLDGAGRVAQNDFREWVRRRIEASEQAVYFLRQAVKQAWFGDHDAHGDLGFIDKMFWDATAAAFYDELRLLMASAVAKAPADDGDAAESAAAQCWLTLLRAKTLPLFETDIVGAGSLAVVDPRRIAKAFHGLKAGLDGKTMRTILNLPLPEAREGEKTVKKAVAKSAKATAKATAKAA